MTLARFLALALVLASCRDAGQTPREPTGAPAAAETVATAAPQLARGLYVWKTAVLLDETDGATHLRELCASSGVGELYVSTPPPVLQDPRFAPFLGALVRQGLRIEALFGEATWYRPDERDRLLGRIGDVARFNAAHAEARFAAVHLDIEPHQLPENKGPDNLTFLPDFTRAIASARDEAARAGMSLSVDIPRKLFRADAPSRAALFVAAPRFFLMLYEIHDPSRADPAAMLTEVNAAVDQQLRLANEGLEPGAVGHIAVALRTEDYGTTTATVAQGMDSAHRGQAGFSGWAVHDYGGLRRLHGR